jgi:hypothetical protein
MRQTSAPKGEKVTANTLPALYTTWSECGIKQNRSCRRRLFTGVPNFAEAQTRDRIPR